MCTYVEARTGYPGHAFVMVYHQSTRAKPNNISNFRSLFASHSTNILLVKGNHVTKLNIKELGKYTLPTLGEGKEKRENIC